MKPLIIRIALICLAGTVFGQGSLTPPGAPGATMKTLTELDTAISQIQGEARTPISQAGITITAAGSYILTTNLLSSGTGSGLTISADNVTVDLNGFSVLCSGASGQGISMNDRNNIVIKNGTIRDAYYFGIAAFRTQNCRFEGLNIIGNGRASSSYDGIFAGTNTTITACIVMDNGSGIDVGPQSKITGNQIINNTSIGLRLYGSGSYVADNIVKGNGDNYDLSTGNQLNILLCEIPESLDWPCAVKLAGTLECTQTGVHGISVVANNITIDLDGHTLIGPGASSGNGIYQSSTYRKLTVLNGKAVQWKPRVFAAVTLVARFVKCLLAAKYNFTFNT